MKTPRKKTSKTNGFETRTILVVDGRPEDTVSLSEAWERLHLADTLRVIDDSREAIDAIRSCGRPGMDTDIGAVVADPDHVGDALDDLLRAARQLPFRHPVPVVFWTRNNDYREGIDGTQADCTVHKPMTLRLIQTLDSSCGLRVRSFHPYPGTIEHDRRRRCHDRLQTR